MALEIWKTKRKRLPARQHTSPLVGHDVTSSRARVMFFSVVFCQATIVLTPSSGNLEWDIFSEMLQMTVMWLDLQKTRFVFLRTLGFPSCFQKEMAGLPDCHPWEPWGEGPAHRDQATREWQGHFGTGADAGDLEWWSHKWRQSVEVFGGSQYSVYIYIYRKYFAQFGWIYGLGGLDKTFAYICNPKRSWFSLANFGCGELRTLIFIWCCFVWNGWFSHRCFLKWAIFHFARNTTFTLQDILKFEGLKRVEPYIWMTHGVLSQLV